MLKLFIPLVAIMVVIFPEIASATGGISEFSAPLEKVMQTVTGPVGKWISIIAMALCGILFVLNKDDISGGFKLLLQVVFGISFIAFASTIVNTMFTFTGAII